jgi:hypothetical protein
VCKEAIDLLQINRHILSGGNHNGMLVERVNRYLNKGLKIMTNERDSVRVAMEAILLLLYAWNSAPIPGTDLSRCFVALGREFQFPIDFSADKHLELTSTPASVTSYSRDLATRLSALREVAALLVDEQRAYHREFINARRPDPKIYSIGDTVFARRTTRSSAMRGQVDKLIYPFTGPWLITAKLDGASYEIQHVATKRTDKKHASDLSPYPSELIAFRPLDGANNQYGQINRKIIDHPYREAGIKGFTPPTPFKVATNFATTNDSLSFTWPTMAELNEELFPYPWSHNEEFNELLSDESSSTIVPGFYTGPPPFAPKCTKPPTIPPAAILAQQLTQSSDKLFFISNSVGSGDVREWRVVRVAFEASMVSYSSCLVDGRYLVDFYISHPSDYRYNAINKRFWLQYHSHDDIMAPSTSANTHLIRPSDNSDTYASRHKLLPFRKYINLTHSDTFIHGPLDFATINNRKSRDRICQSDWDILKSHCDLYHNPLPRFDVPTYSVHVDAGAHTTFYSAALSGDLLSSAQRTLHTPR